MGFLQINALALILCGHSCMRFGEAVASLQVCRNSGSNLLLWLCCFRCQATIKLIVCVPNGESLSPSIKYTLWYVWGVTHRCVLIYSGAVYYWAEYAELVVPPSYTYHINARLEGEQMKGSRFSLHRQIRTHSSKTSVLEMRRQRAWERNNDKRAYNENIQTKRKDQEKCGKVVRTDFNAVDISLPQRTFHNNLSWPLYCGDIRYYTPYASCLWMCLWSVWSYHLQAICQLLLSSTLHLNGHF